MTTPFLLKLYSNLETGYHLDDGMLSYFDDLSPETEEEKEAVSYEYCSLNYVSFDSILNSWDDETREKVATYLKSRIRKAKNKNLLLRYGLFYFSLTKDFKSLNDTIAIGVNILRRIVKNEDQAEVYTFTKWYKILYPISAKTAHFQDMVNLLKDALHAHSAMFRYVVLGMIYYSDQKHIKELHTDVPLPNPLQLGRNFNAADLAELGYTLANEYKEKKAETPLKFAFFYADKSGNKQIVERVYNAYGQYFLGELKPDDPNNLAIAHLNDETLRKAMDCFKKSYNKVEFDKASLLYEENKAKVRLIHFQERISPEQYKQRVESIEKIAKDIVSKGTNAILGNLLGFGICIFIMDAETIEKSIDERKGQYLYQQLSHAVMIDDFGNIKPTTHEDRERHTMIDIAYQNYGYPLFSRIIMEGLQQGSLTYELLADQLLKMGFDLRVEKSNGNEKVGSSILERVDIGLKDFLHQHELMLRGEQPDWRFCITFLSTQFEGILREVVRQMEAPITKMKNITNTENILLEGLLDKDCLHQVFDNNDMLLFRQTFTNDGYNIRNNVAHGLYIPQEYTSTKALLVFVSILRLAKATMRLIKF